MSDVEKCFAFLHDNVPSWSNSADEIEEKIARLQNEISKVAISKSLPVKRRTGSIESLRGFDDAPEGPDSSTTAQQSLLTNRKRKTPSILSRASGPLKYRSRAMVIVQYDGQVQSLFESLVRSIGMGRNMLRKGKIAARMEALADPTELDNDHHSEDDDLMSKIEYRHRTGLSSMRSRGGLRNRRIDTKKTTSGTPAELFDTTDKALEQAQSLCEKAAHQSLRDGNCQSELSGIRKHFKEVLETAGKEVAKYEAQKKEVQNTLEGQRSSTSLPPSAETPTRPTIPSIQSAPATAHSTSKTVNIDMDIELDDDSEEEMNFVMPPIRLTSRT